jgi:hypothetical protein
VDRFLTSPSGISQGQISCTRGDDEDASITRLIRLLEKRRSGQAWTVEDSEGLRYAFTVVLQPSFFVRYSDIHDSEAWSSAEGALGSELERGLPEDAKPAKTVGDRPLVSAFEW